MLRNLGVFGLLYSLLAKIWILRIDRSSSSVCEREAPYSSRMSHYIWKIPKWFLCTPLGRTWGTCLAKYLQNLRGVQHFAESLQLRQFTNVLFSENCGYPGIIWCTTHSIYNSKYLTYVMTRTITLRCWLNLALELTNVVIGVSISCICSQFLHLNDLVWGATRRKYSSIWSGNFITCYW